SESAELAGERVAARRRSAQRAVAQEPCVGAVQRRAYRLQIGLPDAIGSVEGEVAFADVRVAAVREAQLRAGEQRLHGSRRDAGETGVAEEASHPGDRSEARLRRAHVVDSLGKA